jgi:hypothetical protein
VIHRIEELRAPAVGFRAEGKVTRGDYEQVVIPAVRGMLDAHERIRILYVLGDDVDGFTFGAMWQDTKLGLGHLRSWERIAIVTDADWIEGAVKALGWILPGEVRAFDDDDLDEATDWITQGLDGSSR